MKQSMRKTPGMGLHEDSLRFDKRSTFVAAVMDLQSQKTSSDPQMLSGNKAAPLWETPPELRLHHSPANPSRPAIRG